MTNTRGSFDKELLNLKNLIENMGNDTTSYFREVVNSYLTMDAEKAEELIHYDKQINEQEFFIQEKGIYLIARQQPVATDLRKIICAFKISNEIERIADFAVNICKSAIRLDSAPRLEQETIQKMADQSIKMLSKTMEAYHEEDPVKAREASEIDDHIDSLHSSNLETLIMQRFELKENVNIFIQTAYVSRYIERVADHVTNIAEEVIYLVKGERYTLNG
ncbi:phosphate signaling complex protein PhoU [Salibacterium aidingense]|uniref:phosphate signaling complex protein PhoU n=1 Tax=Salibacterium aidingense TaxID=384933 RepID=UPI003BDEF53F